MAKNWKKFWFEYFATCSSSSLEAALKDGELSEEQSFAVSALIALSED